jgi:hypothetical protein
MFVKILVFGAGCPQNCELPPHTCPDVQSEDCLTLNVYTPLPSSTPVPVMVFLPGGRFEQGTASCTLYDGFTQTIHRTNFFQWIFRHTIRRSSCHSQLSPWRSRMVSHWQLDWKLRTSRSKTRYAMDSRQHRRFRWRSKTSKINIFFASFLFSLVTLFGQSAGASSTAMHLISQKSAGLFQQAIMESVPLPLPMKPTDVAQTLGDLFTSDLGCTVGTFSLRFLDSFTRRPRLHA